MEVWGFNKYVLTRNMKRISTMGNDEVEKPTRSVVVKPVNSACNYSILPIEELFIELIQGTCSKIFFMGQIVSFMGYTEPTKLFSHKIEIDDSAGIAKRILQKTKDLYFGNRDDREKQLKDFGKMLWLIETGYLHRQDHFCPFCSDQKPVRFSDIFEFCGRCGAPLELKKYISPRYTINLN